MSPNIPDEPIIAYIAIEKLLPPWFYMKYHMLAQGSDATMSKPISSKL